MGVRLPMGSRLFVSLGVLVLGIPLSGAVGQETLVPRKGDVVRVDLETPGYGVRRIEGQFDGWDEEQIRFMGRLPISRPNVRSFWVSAGRVSALSEGAMIGLGGGIVVGTLLGLASRHSTCGDTAICPLTVGVVYGLGFAVLSTVVGAVMSREDWRPVDLQIPPMPPGLDSGRWPS